MSQGPRVESTACHGIIIKRSENEDNLTSKEGCASIYRSPGVPLKVDFLSARRTPFALPGLGVHNLKMHGIESIPWTVPEKMGREIAEALPVDPPNPLSDVVSVCLWTNGKKIGHFHLPGGDTYLYIYIYPLRTPR